MSEPSGSATIPAPRKRQLGIGNIIRWTLLLGLAVAVGITINAIVSTMAANSTRKVVEEHTVLSSGLITPHPHMLAEKFTDHEGRLLADTPTDPAQLLDPKSIVVAHLESSDDGDLILWKAFAKYLQSALGRAVIDQTYDNGPDQLAKISDGTITLVALHAADAPFLVNNYGYQPMAVLGNEGGANGNHLDIIVPAGSSIASTADLRGHSLTCTVPTSITGYRAAIAWLMNSDQLRPNIDYYVTWSLKQKYSIEGIADKQYEAAAVSDDKLKSLLAKGTLTTDSYKTIYQSDVIPRTTIGYFYNLKPDLAEKIRTAILSYKPVGETSDDTDAGPMHFLAVDYKKDFQLVRQVDDCFDPRLDAKTRVHKTATTQP